MTMPWCPPRMRLDRAAFSSLLDTPDEIARKIKKCKTDSIKGVMYADDRPEANNLLGIYEAMSGQTREQVDRLLQKLASNIFHAAERGHLCSAYPGVRVNAD